MKVSSRRYPVNIPGDLYEKLRKAADEEGVTIHAVILNAIKFYLEKRGEENKLAALEQRVAKLEKGFEEMRSALDAVIKRLVGLERRYSRLRPY